jgi:transcriptional regulator with XRE-family HTH domain
MRLFLKLQSIYAILGIHMLDLLVLGERIRSARERKGLSQGELAKVMGRDQRSISQYENGKRKILITDVPLLARILEVPHSYFFEGEAVLSDFDVRILTEFNRLRDEADMIAAIELIRVFCNAIERNQTE